jgi:hypothetical protein
VLGAAGIAVAASAAAQVTLYDRQSFGGRSFVVDHPIRSLDPTGFNDRAESAVIQAGEWQLCSDADFRGHCAVLGSGEYRDLGRFGLDHNISSIRPVRGDGHGYEGGSPLVAYDYGRRPGERLCEVPVASVHAVVGTPERRCWVERQQVQSGGELNVPGAIIGGVIGGVLGHQIGSGRRRGDRSQREPRQW